MRNQLADRMDEYPPAEWSLAFVTALTAIFDLYAADSLEEVSATVLKLVRSTPPQER